MPIIAGIITICMERDWCVLGESEGDEEDSPICIFYEKRTFAYKSLTGIFKSRERK